MYQTIFKFFGIKHIICEVEIKELSKRERDNHPVRRNMTKVVMTDSNFTGVSLS